MSDLRIVDFNSTREHGQMNKNFYPKDMDPKEKTRLMQANKDALVKEMGLSYKDIFMYIQKTSRNVDKYPDGLCYTLTPDDVSKYDDLYDYDVYADIVKLTPDTKNVAIAFPTADCAVVKAINTKTNEMVISHCGGEYIDRYLPIQTIDALGGSEKDIIVHVSPFAYKLFYEDESNLAWANNLKVWLDCVHHSYNNGVLSAEVDVYKALKQQLLERKIREENLFISPYDTTKSNMFYSNSRGYQDPSFKGRFLAGLALIDNDCEIKDKPYMKVIR